MGSHVVPKKFSYYVYLHIGGEYLVYVDKDLMPVQEWENSGDFPLDQACEVAEYYRKKEEYKHHKICIGRNVTEVDALFNVISIK